MQLIPIKTEVLLPPDTDLLGLIARSELRLRERDVLVIASKIVALSEGRIVPRSGTTRDKLVREEAEWYIDRDEVPDRAVMHAFLHGQLAVAAGIDPFGEWYVLWPRVPMESARKLSEALKATYGLNELGVIVADSKSTPLRRGVIGGAIGWAGFDPLYDNRDRTDLTGRPSLGSQINVADAVAAAAVLVMGEGIEQTPLVIVREAPYVFSGATAKRAEGTTYVVPREEDIFAPFFLTDRWQRGSGGVRDEST